MRPPEIIETSRLRLRPPVIEDAESIFANYAQDAEVVKYLEWRPHKSVKETRKFLRRCLSCWERGSEFPWIITRKEDGGLIGMIEINIDKFMAGLGYVLAKAYWGSGYMTEAARAIADWGLEQEAIFRIWAFCDVDNPASARVMEKIGMRREGILRRRTIHPNVSDEPRDVYCYSIVK